MIFAKQIIRTIVFISLFLSFVGLGTSASFGQIPRGLNEEFLIDIGTSLKKTRAYYAGVTIMSYGKPYGTQIEYFSPNGKNFLWYPGNAGIVKGNWKIRPDKNGNAETCFKYQDNSINPYTKVPGGNWQCAFSMYVMGTDLQRIKGDPFGLSQQMPFKLSKRKTSFKNLARKAKIDARGLRYLPTAHDK